ncbi:hypothetical protein PR202_ga01508 [Eleusine coracana subsp. coracana]|uniref:Plant heme peroxidase family profile domain-containing protein n=1 Tax=Eleusine coracana subsp. coracana TaxID=191504 RepID=A0AAV5BGT4_ELECO|nr:hypothetical protein PR202_ga00821 [Eleusine coracana subsp. coracana]GJM85715.1 hypothetical protein PR202_ga01508 [Eleusine coracana subsp. coracana]
MFTVKELAVLSGVQSIDVAHLSSYTPTASRTELWLGWLAEGVLARPPAFERRLARWSTRDFSAVPACVQRCLTWRGGSKIFSVCSKAFQRQAEYDPLALGLNTRNKGDTLKNKELFKSDWVLPMDGKVAGKLVKYRDKPEEWNVDFAAAMAKLSSLSVQGKILEVRRNCRVTNKQYY